MSNPPFPRGSYALRVVSLSPERRVTSAQMAGVWAVFRFRPHPTRPPMAVKRRRAVGGPIPFFRGLGPACVLTLAGAFWLFLGGLGR